MEIASISSPEEIIEYLDCNMNYIKESTNELENRIISYNTKEQKFNPIYKLCKKSIDFYLNKQEYSSANKLILKLNEYSEYFGNKNENLSQKLSDSVLAYFLDYAKQNNTEPAKELAKQIDNLYDKSIMNIQNQMDKYHKLENGTKTEKAQAEQLKHATADLCHHLGEIYLFNYKLANIFIRKAKSIEKEYYH